MDLLQNRETLWATVLESTLRDCDESLGAHLIMTFSHMSRQARYIVAVLATRLSNFKYLNAASHIMHDVFTLRRNVLIQGPGGCGFVTRRVPMTATNGPARKSTTANAIFREAFLRNITVVMLGPTQQAAEMMLSGETIHSFLGIRQTLSHEQLQDSYEQFMNHRGRFSAMSVCSLRFASPTHVSIGSAATDSAGFQA